MKRGLFGGSVQLGDGIAGLQALEPGSVGLVLSDLPSGETVAPFDRPVDLDALFAASWSAMAPGGNVVLMAHSIRFATKVIAAGGSSFRYDLVWKKSLPTGFLNAKHRPLRQHEFVLVFFRSGATYRAQMSQGHEPIHTYSDADRTQSENYGRHVFNPQMSEGHPPISSNARETTRRKRRGKNSENYDTRERTTGRDAGIARVGATDRYPTSVIEFGSVGVRHPDRVHPQQKPVDLLRYLVRTYSAPGQLVVDVTAGSGSTGDAAIAEGRRFIGWDLDPRFGEAQTSRSA